MKGLGRILALPFLMLALLVQGLAPAQAAAMPRDAFGQPICSADGVPKDGQGKAPLHAAHDCCAAACQAAATLLGPPSQAAASCPPPGVRLGAAQAAEQPTAEREPRGRRPWPTGPPTAS